MSNKDWSNYKLINNTEAAKKRFELKIEGQVAIIEYILTKDHVIYLTHTEVPEALEGKGIGSALVRKTLEFIKNKTYTLVPLCPFVASYLKKHPELADGILQKGYSVK